MTSSLTTTAPPVDAPTTAATRAVMQTPLSRLRRAGPETGPLDDPARSLRIACLVWVALWSFGLFMNNIVSPIVSPGVPLDDAWPWPANPIAFGCILVSVGLLAVSHRPGLSASRLVDLALVYEVVLALGIGIVNQWTPNRVGVSWIVIVILVHPLIVPAPPAKAFMASLVAASMDFVGLVIAGARGADLPPSSVVMWTYLPNYLAAVLAVIPTRVRLRMEEHRATARELGSYEVGELIGRGGMGEIYRAEHKMLVRPAAVKLIRPELLSEGGEDSRDRIVQRFQREAMVTAGLRSPHTVAVYDFGVAQDGRLYYVMELLDGLNLDTLVQKFGAVPAERAVHILLQVCDSLAEAHERGLIHRDIKPSNVYLSRYGRCVDFAKVLDFGLARWEDLGGRDVHLTAEATVLGTPGFMAPEQVAGTPPVGPRTDLYAVGCLAYWLVTGHLVYEAARPIEVIAHHLRTLPVAPSRRTELAIPESLDRVILACLEKDPQQRPASADALAGLLRGVPTSSAWTADRAEQWWNRHLGAPPVAGTPSR